ncbi:hypothetical protein EDD40_0271 [Saccharothrix texasensis]|uniref:Uncharacterized protein n=1 Tax=Saccharothrix texasensis TaxID=103734 RepID=A0A3N1GXU9_9PSEU|nr:hypothetical protein EDD40_0271 [Saccharothrix texasensis]
MPPEERVAMINSLRTASTILPTAVRALAPAVLGPAGSASAGVLDVTCTPPSSRATSTPRR